MAAQVTELIVGAVGVTKLITTLLAVLSKPLPKDTLTAIVSVVLAGVSACMTLVGTITVTLLVAISAAVKTCVTIWPPQFKVMTWPTTAPVLAMLTLTGVPATVWPASILVASLILIELLVRASGMLVITGGIASINSLLLMSERVRLAAVVDTSTL